MLIRGKKLDYGISRNGFDVYLDDQTGILYSFDGKGNIGDVIVYGPRIYPGYVSDSKDEIKLEQGKLLTVGSASLPSFADDHFGFVCLIEIAKVEDKKVIRRKSDGQVLFTEGESYEKLKSLFCGALSLVDVPQYTYRLCLCSGVLGHDIVIPDEIDGVKVKILSCNFSYRPPADMTLILPATIEKLNFAGAPYNFDKGCYEGPREIVVQKESQIKLVKNALKDLKTDLENRTVKIYLKDELKDTVELQEHTYTYVILPSREYRFRRFINGVKKFFKYLFLPIWGPIWLIYKAVECVVVAIKNRIRRNESANQQQKENSMEQKSENVASQDNDEKDNELTTQVPDNPNVAPTSGNDKQEIPLQENSDETSKKNENCLP